MNEYLTADQVRQMLHISKRKCAWMLQNGLLPCENTGKKTRQYHIRREDVIAYQSRSTEVPTLLPRIFSSAKPRRPRIPASDFCERLSKEWSDISDVLTERDVVCLLGYHPYTVFRWISSGHLRATTAHGATLIAKLWLIDFCMGYGFRIVRKSRVHRELEMRLSCEL